MLDPAELIGIAVLALLGFFLFRYLRAGSLVGALLGGRIRETVGETTLASSATSSAVLPVQTLDAFSGREPIIAPTITRKAPLAVSVTPFRLTRAQALEVAELLARAARSV